MELSKRAKNIQPSLTLAITAKAKQLKQEGVSIIGFGAGEPDFDTPRYITEAGIKALNEGFTKYTVASGTAELKKAVCDKFRRDNGLSYDADQIIISNGAKHSLYNAMLALIEEGDEVIIPSPFWLTYPELVTLCDGKSVFVETVEENNFKMTPDQLENAITEKTKILILNTPSNPTGSVYSKVEIEQLAKVLEKHPQVFVISDEIYEFLVYGGAENYSIASVSEEMKNRTIVVNGVSKTYAMTGWRIGYLAAPKPIAKAIASIQSHATSNPNSIAQYATVVALNGDVKEIEQMREVFDDRRKFMVKRINEIDGVSCTTPDGAFYVMMNIKNLIGKVYNGQKIGGSLSFADLVLQEGVAVVPGVAFGADLYVRLSYAISREDISEGLDRIEKFIKKLN